MIARFGGLAGKPNRQIACREACPLSDHLSADHDEARQWVCRRRNDPIVRARGAAVDLDSRFAIGVNFDPPPPVDGLDGGGDLSDRLLNADDPPNDEYGLIVGLVGEGEDT